MDQQAHRPQAAREIALGRRYGRPANPQANEGAWNEVLATLLDRRSTRSFSNTPVSDHDLEAIVAAAQSASNSSNLQAWSVVAVRDRARLARIATLASNQRHVEGAPLLLVFIADLSRLRVLGEHTGTPVEALDTFECYVMGVVDATLAAQNAAVAASSLGLGTCFIGSIRNHPEALAAELKLPPEAFGVFGLVVGHPDPARPTDVKPRFSPHVVLHQEQYSVLDRADLVSYDGVMQAFQERQRMAPGAWTRKSAERVAGPDTLGGRERLLEAMRARGFGLK